MSRSAPSSTVPKSARNSSACGAVPSVADARRAALRGAPQPSLELAAGRGARSERRHRVDLEPGARRGSSGASSSAILTAGVAGLVAGALSMASGEFVSVSSHAIPSGPTCASRSGSCRGPGRGSCESSYRSTRSAASRRSWQSRSLSPSPSATPSSRTHATSLGLNRSAAPGRCRRPGRQRSRSPQAPCCRSLPWP